jgi:hypothetical protein
MVIWLVPLLLLAINATAQVKGEAFPSTGETCSVFSHPELFADQTVTVEAIVEYDEALHTPSLLRTPLSCTTSRALRFDRPDKKRPLTEQDQDFIRFLGERWYEKSCRGCIRYQVDRIVATGRLRRTKVSDLRDGDLSTVNVSNPSIPAYTLAIQHVLSVTANEINYDFVGPAIIIPFPVMSPGRAKQLPVLPESALPPR